MGVRPYFILFTACFFCISQAQESASFYLPTITAFNTSQNSDILSIGSKAFAGSNQANTSMYLDFLGKSSFSDKSKEAFLASSVERGNIDLWFGADITYHFEDNILNKIYVAYENQTYATATGDFAKLAVFGNKKYAGESVSMDEAALLNYETIGVGVSKNIIQNASWKIELDASLNGLTNLKNVSNKSGSFFTEATGDYLDITLSNFRMLENNAKISGANLNVDVDIQHITSQGKVGISVLNIAPTILFNSQEAVIDTSFRFEGIEFLFSDFRENGIENRIETDYTSYYTRKQSAKKFLLLPIDASVYLEKRFSSNTSMQLEASITSFYSLIYGLEGSVDYKLNENSALRGKLGYSTFQGPYISGAYEVALNSFMIYGEVHGISSFAAPTNLGVLGCAVRIAKQI